MPRVPCAFSVQEDFLAMIDQRAKALGMKRSEYIVQVLRQEIFHGNPNLTIALEGNVSPPSAKKSH